jgi:hypothetical protein
MSLLGFDALGRLAVGQLPAIRYVTLTAQASSYTVTGIAATFTITETPAVGSFALTGAATGQLSMAVASGSFSTFGIAQSFQITENVAVGSYVISGSLTNNINAPSDPGTFRLTSVDTPLIRTGDDYEFKLGGVGHFLEEIERQKRLNAITRKIPGPVDRRTVPRFEPLRAPPSAPSAPAPDVAAIQNQRTTEAAAQAEAAKKRRRDEEAVLLLAC